MKRLAKIWFVVFIWVFLPPCAFGETYEASYVPWSGYWWPYKTGALVNGNGYRGSPSPLSKFDFALTGGYFNSAYFYGLENFYDPDAFSWEGLCFSWAVASVMEEEPQAPGVYNGVRFYVGDKKGLLTAAYHRVVYESYPVSRPEEFHKILQDYIQIQKIPIIIDVDSNGEVWNYPVYKFNTSYVQSGDTRHYTTTIYYPEDSVSPDYAGTFVQSNTYYYYFTLGDADTVDDAGWEDKSIEDHPLRAYEPFGLKDNPSGLDYDAVKAIVDSDDDEYEENDLVENAASIFNGNYDLLANDLDFFKCSVKQGDFVQVALEGEDVENVGMKIYQPGGGLIVETTGGTADEGFSADADGDLVFEFEPFAQWASYDLSISVSLPEMAVFPTNMNGNWYNGVALLDAETGSLGRVVISLVEQSGQIANSYFANSNEKHLMGTVETTFGMSSTDGGYIRIDSDQSLRGLEALSNGNSYLIGSNLLSVPASSFHFPYLSSGWGYQTIIGLVNEGEQTEIVERTTYDSDGLPMAEDSVELKPGQKIENGSLSIVKSGTRGMSMVAQSGSSSLYGYLKLKDQKFGSTAQALVSLHFSGENELIAPHVANSSGWWTIISIINGGDSASSVVIYAFDGNGDQVGTYELALGGKQSLVGKVSELFPNSAEGEIAAMKIVSSNSGAPLSGYMMYGSSLGSKLAGMPLREALEPPIYFPHMASSQLWHTGFGTMNCGTSVADLIFTLFDAKGATVDAKTVRLKPNQRLGTSVSALFGTASASASRYMKVEPKGAATPISGVYVIGSSENLRLMGDVMH